MASSLTRFVALFLLVALPLSSALISDKLKPGFYESTCPNVEKIIQGVLTKKAQTDRGFIPGIIRLHFHDCFITGCDASILLKPERYVARSAEMSHPANSVSLRGMDVLDEAKAELEKQCPGVVSCADVLAYAARDSIVLAGNPSYTVPAGRRDSRLADGNLASGLPKGNDSIPILTQLYAEKDLTVEDLVVLEGSHSIGRSRCLRTISDPGSVNGVPGSAEKLDKKFADIVKHKFCYANPNDFWNYTVPLNLEKLDTDWGTSFYRNILSGKSPIPADLGMAIHPSTKGLVEKFAQDSELWKKMFNEAMIKLGKLNVLTGDKGEIRKTCSIINAVNQPVSDPDA